MGLLVCSGERNFKYYGRLNSMKDVYSNLIHRAKKLGLVHTVYTSAQNSRKPYYVLCLFHYQSYLAGFLQQRSDPLFLVVIKTRRMQEDCLISDYLLYTQAKEVRPGTHSLHIYPEFRETILCTVFVLLPILTSWILAAKKQPTRFSSDKNKNNAKGLQNILISDYLFYTQAKEVRPGTHSLHSS